MKKVLSQFFLAYGIIYTLLKVAGLLAAPGIINAEATLKDILLFLPAIGSLLISIAINTFPE